MFLSVYQQQYSEYTSLHLIFIISPKIFMIRYPENVYYPRFDLFIATCQSFKRVCQSQSGMRHRSTNDAYIISCGHLFDGTEPPGPSIIRNAKIHVFYKNDEKLQRFQSFNAQLVCHSAEEDISILTFKPDWVPQHYFAIAPENYPIQVGESFESVGCDHAEETAAYTVEIVDGIQKGRNLVTKNNSARPGRSGGGLLSKEFYCGVVWGTSKLDGSGYTFNVPLRRIHAYLGKYEQTKWLLGVGLPGAEYQRIPIINIDGSQYKVPDGYFPSIISPRLVSPNHGR